MTDFDLTPTDMQAVKAFDSGYLNTKGANYYRQGEYGKAIDYYRLAAAMGNNNAISNLGYCYLYGRSIVPNLSMALAYFDLAYQKGNPDAAYKLGDIYENPKWGLVDKELSLYYYQQAIKLITDKSLYELGDLSWYDELKQFPSLCFAFGRALLPQGALLTDIDLAFQFLKFAQEGYENEISNGSLIYQNQLESVKKMLTDEVFTEMSWEDDDDFICSGCNSDSELLRLAKVTFESWGQEYSYLCDDESIEEGHRVLVPVGDYYDEKIATIKEIYFAKASELDFPVHRLKEVIKRYSSFDKARVSKTIENLELNGRCLDLTAGKVNIAPEESYDYLKTPMGNFWLELNQSPLPMKVSQTFIDNERYTVDYGLKIFPTESQFEDFVSLELCSDFDVSLSRYIDIISDERVYGSTWESDGIQFGITASESYEEENEVDFKVDSQVPYYADWGNDYATQYRFNLAWKSYQSDDDLSVYFYTT